MTSKKSSKSTVIRNSRLVKFDFIFITNESNIHLGKLVIFNNFRINVIFHRPIAVMILMIVIDTSTLRGKFD